MNIGDAAKATGLSSKTIRYYESIDLIAADRQENGYRTYTDAHVHKLRFVQRARGLGFSIDDCRALLSLYQDKHRASAEVKNIAQKHLEEIIFGVMIIGFLIVEPAGFNRLWQIGKEKLRKWPFPY